jgi:hypothetical protein
MKKMTDEEAAAVVKDWCNKNNIQFIDDMDKIAETYRAKHAIANAQIAFPAISCPNPIILFLFNFILASV